MAKFQETTKREYNGPNRKLTPDDIEFLMELQTELCTQDTMGQADPRFWVIAGRELYPTDKDSAEQTVLVCVNDGETVASDFEQAIEWFKSELQPVLMNKCGTGLDIDEDNNVGSVPGSHIRVCDAWDCLEDITDTLTAIGLCDYQVRYLATKPVRYTDTMFLTHKDAEDHLRKYGYNYDEDAHAFAMTAHRSPSVERLWELLQNIDWQTSLPTAKQKE